MTTIGGYYIGDPFGYFKVLNVQAGLKHLTWSLRECQDQVTEKGHAYHGEYFVLARDEEDWLHHQGFFDTPLDALLERRRLRSGVSRRMLTVHGVVQLCLLSSNVFQRTQEIHANGRSLTIETKDQQIVDLRPRRLSSSKRALDCRDRALLVESLADALLAYEEAHRIVDGLKERGYANPSWPTGFARSLEDIELDRLKQILIAGVSQPPGMMRTVMYPPQLSRLNRAIYASTGRWSLIRHMLLYDILLARMREAFNWYGPREWGKAESPKKIEGTNKDAIYYAMENILRQSGVKGSRESCLTAAGLQRRLDRFQFATQKILEQAKTAGKN